MNYFHRVDARFYFFNGKDRYTVEYTTGLSTWYVFTDRMQSFCVYRKYQKISTKGANWDKAESILDEYLQTLENKQDA